MKFLTYRSFHDQEKDRILSWLRGLDPTIKRLIIMRLNLFTLLLCISIVNVSASVLAQGITLKYKNASIEEVFTAIKKQSGFQFLYTKKMLNNAKKVSIEIKSKSLQQTLEQLFKEQPFTYEIIDKTIVVKEKRVSIDRNQQQTNIDVRGLVVDQDSKALIGATVKVKGATNGVLTNQQGEFYLKSVAEGSIIQVIYIGYAMQELTARKELGTIQMQEAVGELSQIDVTVSTGYQNIPKERATGSFTQIDNKTLNRNVGINILDRLEGVTSGLLLNRNLPTGEGANSSKIAIHGRSTLFASPEPLIILDGFPYEGNLDQINPADIENITILKDAAAASIWGTRAGNGVVIITSKNGRQNQPLAINVASTITIGNKPDQYYLSQISPSDYVDLETFMFSKGYYNSAINRQYSPISPAVELLKQRRNNQITDTELNEKLNPLRNQDVRYELEKYYYRPSVNQQYQLNLNGGTTNNWYYLSAGYDKNLQNTITDKYDRLTLTARNTYAFLKQRLKISGDMTYNSSNIFSKYDTYQPYTPYDRLTDEHGKALSVVTSSTLSEAYTSSAAVASLLDWKFRPLDEFIPNQQRQFSQFKINTAVNFEIVKGLNLSGSYQYLKQTSDIDRNNPLSSFYTRNLINTYSAITNNVINRVIELGDILNLSNSKSISKIGRVQLNFNRTFSTDHEVNAIAGFEASDLRYNLYSQTLYGYVEDTQVNRNSIIDPQKLYPYFYAPGSSSRINTAPGTSNRTDISQSLYANASYSYKQRYILSASARQDKSNLFGVNTNQKGVPLWSAGLAWLINKENFYDLTWLPTLKLRTTFGYSGNVDRSVSGLLTSKQSGVTNEWGSLYTDITNPPNPDLRWEQVKTWNAGIDFGLKGNRVYGSIDVYQKNAFDLIGNSPIAMQSGVTQFRGNSANLRTRGVDVLLNTRNLTGLLGWNSSLLFNYNIDKVTSYKIKQGTNNNIVSRNYDNPLEGYPYYAIYSYPLAGLDAAGAPQGYLNGQVSKSYSNIINLFDPSQIIYHGSASPKYFGSLLNTFSYKNIELSINITYKLGYYFKRKGIFNGSYSTSLTFYGDYDKRWQKPGDEQNTIIPALVYPSSSAMTSFFNNSSDLIERGDHIRLQDVRLSYNLVQKQLPKLPFKAISAFAYAKNLGLLWRKNKLGIDPDYGTRAIPDPLSLSFGINLNL